MDTYYVSTIADADGNHRVHTSACKDAPGAAYRVELGVLKSQAEALRHAATHYPKCAGCAYCTLDEGFYGVALDGLEAYRHPVLTIQFLTGRGLPVPETPEQMRKVVEAWLNGSNSRCMELLEYVDELRMWGRQSVFLFEVDPDYLKELADPGFVKNLEGGRYERPAYIWEADDPVLVHAERDADRLIFKLVDMRESEVLDGGKVTRVRERSTNFFVVDLKDRFAELRLQQLPEGALRHARAERELLLEEIGKHLDLGKFTLVQLEPVMVAMLRIPFYPIVSSTLKARTDKSASEETGLLAIVNQLFRRPIPREIRAYLDCEQAVLGKRPVRFRLTGTTDHVTIEGTAHPARVNEILRNIVAISRGDGIDAKGRVVDLSRDVIDPTLLVDEPLRKRGLVSRPLAELDGKPIPQAVVLSAGAIAAAILWIVIEGGGNYLFEQAVNKALHGVPLVAITVVVEIAWTWLYYGSSMVGTSFRKLFRLAWRDILREIREAAERGKTRAEHNARLPAAPAH